MTNGSVACWGSNDHGQLGQGYIGSSISAPALVSGLSARAKHVAAGGYHTCVVLDDGAVLCWGRCLETQIGDGTAACTFTVAGKPEPTPVFGLGAGSEVVKIAAGRLHTCAVMSNGSAVCWGGVWWRC